MKNKNITAYIVLFMVVSVHGFAQNNDAILSYDDYVSIMIKQLPQIKNNIIQVKKAQVNVEKAKSVDDTTLIAQGQYTHQKQYTTGKNLFEPDYSETYYGYAGIERIIAPTGTRLSAGFEYDASSVKGNRTIPAQAMSIDEYQPSIKATITQPLLKNVFGIADRYGKNNAEYTLQIQKLQQREDDDSVMNYYKKLYFTWIFYKQAIDILAESIANAKNLVVTVERKAKAGLAENDDLQRAYSSLYSYQADYQQYQITYKALLDELWLYITKDATPDSAYLQKYFNEIVTMDIQ
ncbi:MAG TPA: TolC family protein [Spirochaetota bacterium]|nr:TolC family protein [Spirochaetota bacterium]